MHLHKPISTHTSCWTLNRLSTASSTHPVHEATMYAAHLLSQDTNQLRNKCVSIQQLLRGTLRMRVTQASFTWPVCTEDKHSKQVSRTWPILHSKQEAKQVPLTWPVCCPHHHNPLAQRRLHPIPAHTHGFRQMYCFFVSKVEQLLFDAMACSILIDSGQHKAKTDACCTQEHAFNHHRLVSSPLPLAHLP